MNSTSFDTLQPPSVTLYVVPDCPLCARARAWLERHGVAYRERDVANDFGALRRMYRLTRQRLVPVVEASGRVMVRPTEEELQSMFGGPDSYLPQRVLNVLRSLDGLATVV